MEKHLLSHATSQLHKAGCALEDIACGCDYENMSFFHRTFTE